MTDGEIFIAGLVAVFGGLTWMTGEDALRQLGKTRNGDWVTAALVCITGLLVIGYAIVRMAW